MPCDEIFGACRQPFDVDHHVDLLYRQAAHDPLRPPGVGALLPEILGEASCVLMDPPCPPESGRMRRVNGMWRLYVRREQSPEVLMLIVARAIACWLRHTHGLPAQLIGPVAMRIIAPSQALRAYERARYSTDEMAAMLRAPAHIVAARRAELGSPGKSGTYPMTA
jgi:hypothetical protein